MVLLLIISETVVSVSVGFELVELVFVEVVLASAIAVGSVALVVGLTFL